jgi:hypothetical protein
MCGISLFQYSMGFIITTPSLVVVGVHSINIILIIIGIFSLGLPNYSPSVKPLTMNERVYVSMQNGIEHENYRNAILLSFD